MFDENLFIYKYNSMSFLSSEENLKKETNVWSKMYYDHATYYYKSYQYYKNKNTTKAQSNIKTATSVIGLSLELYDVENKILDYYNKGDIVIEVVDSNSKDTKETNATNINQSQEKVYVYKNNSDITIFWIIAIGLFLMIIAIVIDNEIRRNSRHQKIQSALLELEKKLSQGHISKFTYEDMKKSYLKELKEIEQRSESPRLKRYEQAKETEKQTIKKKPKQKAQDTKKK